MTRLYKRVSGTTARPHKSRSWGAAATHSLCSMATAQGTVVSHSWKNSAIIPSTGVWGRKANTLYEKAATIDHTLCMDAQALKDGSSMRVKSVRRATAFKLPVRTVASSNQIG